MARNGGRGLALAIKGWPPKFLGTASKATGNTRTGGGPHEQYKWS